MISIHVQILLIILFWNSDCQIIPKIEECGLSCSQGIHCKSKPSSGIFNSFCHDAPASLSSMVLKSMKISTVMKCVQGSPCSLHLNIKGTLSLDDCRNSDVGKYISACSAGKFDYNVDRARKVISVNVSDFLRDQDYYIRLCHKWFTCEDVGAFAVIEGKESLKSVSLKYSQLLPCLCIEGWLAIPDARRIQLCPFENDTKVLWDNIVYNPVTQTLAWEPACPVLVTVNLCRLMKSNDHCEDIENSFKNSPEKQVKYSRVDTHPRLCMKFTTKQGSWVKCPFAHGEFPAWKMRTAAVAEQIQVFFTSQMKAQFSVLVCNRTQLASCESVGMHHSVSVGDSVSITMSQEMCGSAICIQGWRTDVDYSVPLQICDIHCDFRGQTYSDGNPAKAMIHRMKSVHSLH
ncbi:interleukin-17 receptor E-like protein isoform X7 [Phalacrocorax aristotelis]|uniref:interleukin-17 receptor E-like protein isoform X7 n=1 Tax=Phalacrocorax aristotelis TaxID=126867 RepID=UPI003F4B0231